MNGLQELIKETVRERAAGLPATPVPWATLRARRRRHRRQVGGTAAAIAVAGGALLAAGPLGWWPGSPDQQPAVLATVPAITHPVKVSGLVGVWQVAAAGTPGSTVARFGVNTAGLPGPCGDLEASWIASVDGQFAATLAYGPVCGKALPKQPPWLGDAVRFRAAGTGWTLLGRDGAVLARLSPAPGAPQPKLTAAEVARLDRVLAPLPAGRSPVTAAQLVGTWIPESLRNAADAVPGHTKVTFAPDGEPRWLLDPLGGVQLTRGISTMVCATLPDEPGQCANVPAWFDGTRVAYEQGRLVLYDPSGRAVHRLVRG